MANNNCAGINSAGPIDLILQSPGGPATGNYYVTASRRPKPMFVSYLSTRALELLATMTNSTNKVS